MALESAIAVVLGLVRPGRAFDAARIAVSG